MSSSVARNYSTSHLSDMRTGGGGSANYDDLSLISAQFHAEVGVDTCMCVLSRLLFVFVLFGWGGGRGSGPQDDDGCQLIWVLTFSELLWLWFVCGRRGRSKLRRLVPHFSAVPR